MRFEITKHARKEMDRRAIPDDTVEAILQKPDQIGLDMFGTIVAAMPARFDNVAKAAAELCEPQARFIQVPRRTLKTEADINAWVEEVKTQLKSALNQGPIIIG